MNAQLRAFLATATLLIGVALPLSALAFTSPGTPTGYVNDFAGVLSAQTITTLNTELQQFDASTSIQISVATVKSMNGEDIDTYANELFRAWGIGQKNTNNGVLLLVAPTERKVRIEVGYGLEGALTDLQSGYIIDNIITPSLHSNDYDTGVTSGVHAIEKVVQGEKFTIPASQSSTSKQSGTGWFIEIAWIVLVVFSYLGSILARSKSWWLGGMLGALGGGFAGYLLGGFIFLGAGALILGILGLIFDYFVSKTYQSRTGRGLSAPWFIGGGGFGGGSSSGGFGGFGGGSSGGGGASGSF